MFGRSSLHMLGPESKAVLDSGFQSLVRFRILSAVFRIPKPRIPDSTNNNFPDCGIRIPPMFHRLSLHGSINMDNSSIVGSEFTFFVEKSHQFAQEYIKADDVITATT